MQRGPPLNVKACCRLVEKKDVGVAEHRKAPGAAAFSAR